MTFSRAARLGEADTGVTDSLTASQDRSAAAGAAPAGAAAGTRALGAKPGRMSDPRGNPWEHDPGPPPGSGWAELFARTPNYRGLGAAVLHREAFRWHFGPMFYRGRLDGAARVVVIGQEGAQDESLAHRSFTGAPGRACSTSSATSGSTARTSS
jgi:hypothetical protein